MRGAWIRLWRRVSNIGGEGCWEWTGSVRDSGYGQVWWDGKPRAVHRIVYEAKNGPIEEGKVVCHTCDNRRCVRPSHLWLGVQEDNIRDATAKGRMGTRRRGLDHPKGKLSNEDVALIKAYVDAGGRQIDMVRRFGVSASLVSSIVAGRRRPAPQSAAEASAEAAADAERARRSQVEALFEAVRSMTQEEKAELRTLLGYV